MAPWELHWKPQIEDEFLTSTEAILGGMETRHTSGTGKHPTTKVCLYRKVRMEFFVAYLQTGGNGQI